MKNENTITIDVEQGDLGAVQIISNRGKIKTTGLATCLGIVCFCTAKCQKETASFIAIFHFDTVEGTTAPLFVVEEDDLQTKNPMGYYFWELIKNKSDTQWSLFRCKNNEKEKIIMNDISGFESFLTDQSVASLNKYQHEDLDEEDLDKDSNYEKLSRLLTEHEINNNTENFSLILIENFLEKLKESLSTEFQKNYELESITHTAIFGAQSTPLMEKIFSGIESLRNNMKASNYLEYKFINNLRFIIGNLTDVNNVKLDDDPAFFADLTATVENGVKKAIVKYLVSYKLEESYKICVLEFNIDNNTCSIVNDNFDSAVESVKNHSDLGYVEYIKNIKKKYFLL